MSFYTYMWLREDGTPYYVGKGTGSRAFTSKNHCVHRPHDAARIIVQHWSSEQEAFEMEMWWIALYGRKDVGTGCLRNRSNGGDGVRGPRGPLSTEHKRKIGKASRSWERSEEFCRSVSMGKKKAGVSEASREFLKRFGAIHRGKPWSAARRAAQEARVSIRLTS
jgi:hypothetical protein